MTTEKTRKEKKTGEPKVREMKTPEQLAEAYIDKVDHASHRAKDWIEKLGKAVTSKKYAGALSQAQVDGILAYMDKAYETFKLTVKGTVTTEPEFSVRTVVTKRENDSERL